MQERAPGRIVPRTNVTNETMLVVGVDPRDETRYKKTPWPIRPHSTIVHRSKHLRDLIKKKKKNVRHEILGKWFDSVSKSQFLYFPLIFFLLLEKIGSARRVGRRVLGRLDPGRGPGRGPSGVRSGAGSSSFDGGHLRDQLQRARC